MRYPFDCWEILGIDITNNAKIIKKAYAKKTKQYHPEEYPEEFKNLQEAYKLAIAYTRTHKGIKDSVSYNQNKNSHLENDNINIRESNKSPIDIISDNNKNGIIDMDDQSYLINIQIGKQKKDNQNADVDVNLHKQKSLNQVKKLRNYHLDKVKILLRNNPNRTTIENIFLNKYITAHLNCYVFKKKLEKILIAHIDVSKASTNGYLKQLAKQFRLKRLKNKIRWNEWRHL